MDPAQKQILMQILAQKMAGSGAGAMGAGVAGGMLAPSDIGQEDFSQNAQAGGVDIPRNVKNIGMDQMNIQPGMGLVPQGDFMVPGFPGGQQQAGAQPGQNSKALLNKIVINRIQQSRPREYDVSGESQDPAMDAVQANYILNR